MDDRDQVNEKHLDEDQQSTTVLPWDRFSNWIHCCCVVTFDLELGQAMEVLLFTIFLNVFFTPAILTESPRADTLLRVLLSKEILQLNYITDYAVNSLIHNQQNHIWKKKYVLYSSDFLKSIILLNVLSSWAYMYIVVNCLIIVFIGHRHQYFFFKYVRNKRWKLPLSITSDLPLLHFQC